MACVMTSSPTRLMSWSTFSTLTRIEESALPCLLRRGTGGVGVLPAAAAGGLAGEEGSSAGGVSSGKGEKNPKPSPSSIPPAASGAALSTTVTCPPASKSPRPASSSPATSSSNCQRPLSATNSSTSDSAERAWLVLTRTSQVRSSSVASGWRKTSTVPCSRHSSSNCGMAFDVTACAVGTKRSR